MENISKPTKDSLINSAAHVAGASVGIAAAQGADSIYPQEKEDRTKKLILKGLAAGVLFLGASAIHSDKPAYGLAKGFGYGAAGKTAVSLVGDLMEGGDLAKADSTDNSLIKFAQNALDLKSCACDVTTTANTERARNIAIAQLNFAAQQKANQTINMNEVAPGQYSAASFG